VRLLIEIDQG